MARFSLHEKFKEDILLRRLALTWNKVNVTLDPSTAHANLILSQDLKGVRWGCRTQDVPDHPSRFDWEPFVLGRESFTSGCHWWEVEVEGVAAQALPASQEPSVRRKGESRLNERQRELKENMEVWAVGAARESVVRKGKVNFNPNGGIWALGKALTDSLRPPLSPYRLTAFTSSERTHLNLRHEPRKIRVCLDYEEDRVDFFDANTELMIFTFHAASFSGEKICPFFGAYWGVKLSC